ncbi:hypothetical protein AXW83_06375 [Bosea sp. PAMC 26642]|nr:hypothetical protein AXW83_06375 [Bosea sp. PAMC 26642]
MGVRFDDVAAEGKLMNGVGQTWAAAGKPVALIEEIAERATRAGKNEVVAKLVRTAYDAGLIFDERTPLLQQEQSRYLAERKRKSDEAKIKAKMRKEQLLRDEVNKVIQQRDAETRARAAAQSAGQPVQSGSQKPGTQA